ncbi:MAG: Smr/MutS family protein [Steroidobacteraceae bacterium]
MAKQRSTDAAAGAPASDDALIFRAAVRDVKPLAQTEKPEGLEQPRARAPARARAAATAPAPRELAESMPLIAASPADAADAQDSFRRPGVRTSVLRRLRRGLYPIEDELDLHGLSQAEARDRLAEFIAFHRNAGHRCLRIIHGKGYRSGARGPILKIAVNSWLRRLGDVVAFTSARGIDGGTGAVYVLLRA